MTRQRVDMEHSRLLLRELVHGRMPGPGDYETGLPGVRLYRRDRPNGCGTALYSPVIVKMVQGCKRATVGNQEFRYGEEDVMVTGVDIPGVSLIVEATPQKPCTSLSIDLDRGLIAQLALEMPPPRLENGPAVKGMLVQPLDSELLDAFVRLAGLLDAPEKLAVLGPMIVREIHYLLLLGPNGLRLRSFHTLGSRGNQVAEAITWLKRNLAAPVQVEELAEKVNMAPSTFHRHFKGVTSLSPIQFQKRLRLHEARRLMLNHGLDAGGAGAAVGYDSLSQFSREYKRLFGEPPRKNVRRMQEEAAPAGAGRVAELGEF